MNKIFIYVIYCFMSLIITVDVRAATVKGIDFQDRISVGSQELVLHGVGLLKWGYLVKVYLVALYLPENTPV